MYSLFSYLLRFLINQLRRLKIFVFKGEKPLRFSRATAFWRNEIGDRKREDQKVEVQFVLELPLLAFFYHKHSNGLFNTKLFYSDIFG